MRWARDRAIEITRGPVAISVTAAAARMRLAGGARSIEARGTSAAARTVTMMAVRSAQAGKPSIVARPAGPPADTRPPPASARSPAAIAGATSGTTARLTAGATSERRPKASRTIGRVAACAASETPRLSASQARTLPGCGPSSRAVSGAAQAIRPAVAALDSWNPASTARPGSTRRSRNTAQPSAVAARAGRALSRARSTTPAIAAARSTAADAPANAVYAPIATAMSTARRRRRSRPPNAPTAPPTIAMFHPEIATT